ncbi:hypothetical protein Tco_0694830 [Tanacetum coccineum]
MNQNYDPNFCYDPIYSGFDQYQPPQFPEIHYPPQTTDTELLQARENLMETIQAFLKEYDHIPPEEKCMALLLAEERFLKIKQAVEEEQNQPEVMQELLLKLMNDLQILKGIQPKQAEQEEQAAKSFTSYGNFSMIDDVKVLQDRENLMKDIQTFLRKFSRIPFGEIPKVLLIAWERFSEIKHAFTDKQYQQEDIQELMSKLLEDVRNINEELSEFINSPSWNRPTFYNDDDEYTIIYRKHKEITPDLPIEEPDNSLSMGDEHLNTIPETEKSSVENLVPSKLETQDIEPDAPVITIDKLNETTIFDPGGGEIDVSQNIEDDNSFAFVIRTFLPYLTYLVDSPLLLFTGSEDTIFDPGIHLEPRWHSSGWNFHDYPDFEDSRAHGFVHSFELHILSFI